MNIFGLNISTKAALTRELSNIAAQSGLYNEKLFGWLGNNTPIFWEDAPLNYVKNGYQSNGDVYTCIDMIITKLSLLPLIPYTVKDENLSKAKQYKTLLKGDVAKAKLFNIQTKALVETPIDGINQLLNNPNPLQTYSDWIKSYAGFYLLNGNTYNYYNGLPGSKKWTEMYVLPAPLVNIISGGDLKPVVGYNIYFSRNFRDNLPDFPAEQVSHLKTWNPDFTSYGSQLYGQAPLRAYITTLVSNRDARIEQDKQVKNGGAMGILSPKLGAPSINDQNVKADLKRQIAEAKNSNDLVKRIFVSGAPAEWIQFGLPSVELQLLELLALGRVDIANCFKVPVQLLNNTEASTDNNMKWAVKQLIYNAVMSLGDAIADRLTRDICQAYQKNGEKIVLMFDYSVLPEMAEDMQQLATALNTMWWVTPNEKREYQGWGKYNDAEADKMLVPRNYTPLDDLALSDNTFNNAPNQI